MSRVLHVRIHGTPPPEGEADVLSRFDDLVALRTWRDERPWLAGPHSADLFRMEFFRHATIESAAIHPELGELLAASFVRISGDETDALAALFVMRDLSEMFDLQVSIVDPENPIAKLRAIELRGGRLLNGRPLESILVRRPVFKKMPSGFRIEFIPPRNRGSGFVPGDRGDPEGRGWGFHIHGMRGSAPTFLEAEAEAMRIYNGLRFLE